MRYSTGHPLPSISDSWRRFGRTVMAAQYVLSALMLDSALVKGPRRRGARLPEACFAMRINMENCSVEWRSCR